MAECEECGAQFTTQRGLETHTGKMHNKIPKKKLIELYIHQNLSAKKIAERVGVAHRTVKHRLSRFNLWGKDPAKFHLERSGDRGPYDGYPRWTHTGDGQRLRVHRLLMIAKGADPHKVFGGKYSVDHINGCSLDNREENLRLMENGDHGKKDGKRSGVGYTHKEYLQALISEPPKWAKSLTTKS